MLENIDKEFKERLQTSADLLARRNPDLEVCPYVGKHYKEAVEEVLKNYPFIEVRTHGRREVRAYYLDSGNVTEIRHFYLTSQYSPNRMNFDLTFCGNVKRWWVG